jgi:hypothetical protein
MAVTVDNFTEIAVSCLSAFEQAGKVQDAVFSGDPVFAWLNAKGKKEMVSGGDQIKVNVRRAKNTTVGSYAGWDVLDMTPQDTLGYAYYPWAQYGGSVAIDNATILKNRSKMQIVDLVADKTQELTDSLVDAMTVDMYGDGTGNGGKDLLGLAALVDSTGTLAGIDRSTYTWWASNEAAKSDASVTTAMLSNYIHTCRGPAGNPQKQGKVDLIVTTQTLYESIESLYDDKLRIPASDLTMGKLGFEALKYKGAEIVYSPNCTDEVIYFLSSDNIGLRVMEGRDFKFTDFKDPLVNGQDGKVAFCLWMGQVIVNNPRRLGKLTGVHA